MYAWLHVAHMHALAKVVMDKNQQLTQKVMNRVIELQSYTLREDYCTEHMVRVCTPILEAHDRESVCNAPSKSKVNGKSKNETYSRGSTMVCSSI